MSEETKQRFSISMSPDLVKRIDVVAEARSEGRATVIERMCRNGIAQEEEFLRDMENPVTRAAMQALWNRPRLLQKLAKLVGDELTEEDLKRGSEVMPRQAEAGKKRRAAKRGAKKEGEES